MRLYPLLPLILSLFFYGAFGQMKWDTTRLQSFLDHLTAQEGGMGSVAIYHQGKPFYQYAWGFAQMNPRHKNSPDTRFRIGSITKTYTASIIHQLAEQGKLNLQAPLANWFPDFPHADSIRLEQMLLHRSGLYNFTSSPRYQSASDSSFTQAQLLAWMKSGAPAFAPGAKFGYSNTNYVLLSYIAEAVSQSSFTELLQQNIFQPLQLKRTTFGRRPKTNGPTAQSYVYAGDSWTPDPDTHLSIPGAAGAIVSTAAEVAAFYDALFSGEVVSEEALSQMKPDAYQFGHGLVKIPFYDRLSYGHTGGIDHYRTAASYFPEDELTVVLLTNGLRLKFNDLMIGVLSTLYGKDYEFPEIAATQRLPAAWLQSLTGVYSSPQFPLDITITTKEGQLQGQATGQPSFTLEARDSTHFALPEAGLKMHFRPQKNLLIFTQMGNTFELERKAETDK